MNILQTIAAPDWGGIAYRTVEQAGWLNRNGHTCWLACPPASEVYTRAALAGVPVLEFDFSHPYALGTILELRGLVKSLNIHLIESHTGRCANAAILARDLCGLIRTRHITKALKPSFGRALRGRYAWDWTVATADAIAEQMRQTGLAPAERLSVIGEWAEARFFQRDAWPGRRALWRERLGVEEGTFVIGAVGMLRPEKGFDVLLRAMALLQRDHADFRLVIAGGAAGDPLWERHLRTLAGELGLGESVRFLGYQNDVPGLLQAFDVVAVPSLMEAQSRVVPEALASERPVVASAVGGIGELIHDDWNGWLVEPGNEIALAASLEMVRANAGRTADVRRAAGHVAAQHLTIDAKMRSYLPVYRAARNRRLGHQEHRQHACQP